MADLAKRLAEWAQMVNGVTFDDHSMITQIFGLLHWLVGDPTYAMMIGTLYMGALAALILIAYKAYVMISPTK